MKNDKEDTDKQIRQILLEYIPKEHINLVSLFAVGEPTEEEIKEANLLGKEFPKRAVGVHLGWEGVVRLPSLKIGETLKDHIHELLHETGHEVFYSLLTIEDIHKWYSLVNGMKFHPAFRYYKEEERPKEYFAEVYYRYFSNKSLDGLVEESNDQERILQFFNEFFKKVKRRTTHGS